MKTARNYSRAAVQPAPTFAGNRVPYFLLFPTDAHKFLLHLLQHHQSQHQE